MAFILYLLGAVLMYFIRTDEGETEAELEDYGVAIAWPLIVIIIAVQRFRNGR
jgi:hypothetical protein